MFTCYYTLPTWASSEYECSVNKKLRSRRKRAAGDLARLAVEGTILHRHEMPPLLFGLVVSRNALLKRSCDRVASARRAIQPGSLLKVRLGVTLHSTLLT